MLWKVISYKGKINLGSKDGKTDSEDYKHFLSDSFYQPLMHCLVRTVLFKQDSAAFHSSTHEKRFT